MLLTKQEWKDGEEEFLKLDYGLRRAYHGSEESEAESYAIVKDIFESAHFLK